MSSTYKAASPNYPWATCFIEIALRAIRRLHYEYQMWSVGHQWMRNKPEPNAINIGSGIELADELAVCAAITQDFISSQLTSGAWIEENQQCSISEGIRYWRIDREQPYGDSQQRVDICVKRYVLNESENELEPLDPVFIEAKRARRWQSKISDATIISKPYSIPEVREDICKLRNEKMKKQECGITIHSHLLIWNIYEGFDDHVDTFFECLGDAKVSVHQVRWLPISWDFPKVSKWLWIALAEVE